MNAIIQSKTTGEVMVAKLDDNGDAVAVSAAIPYREYYSPESGETDYSGLWTADIEPLTDLETEEPTTWESDTFTVLEVAK